jgi:hypothetical protein
VTRRQLLASGAATLAAAALPWPMQASSAAQPSATPLPTAALDDLLARVLALAARAPSSHNVQPWLVRLAGPGRLLVGIDPGRRLPEVDPAGRELALSVGCFLENLAQAATAEGLRAELEPAGAGEAAEALVAVRLAAGPADGSAADRLRGRRTLRSGHLPRPLPGADLRQLLALAGPDAAFYPLASGEGRRIAEATVEAMRQQTGRDAAQQELAGWIRFRDEDVRLHADGLTVASMEATGLAGFVMRHFFDASSVTGRTFREKGIEQCARQVTEGAGFLVLASSGPGVPALLEAGRRLGRVALALPGRGIAAHPMSQALEEAPWRDALGAELGLGGELQFVVRLGCVDRMPAPVSPRRPPAAFVRP